MLLCKKPYYLESQKMYVDCGHCRACRLRRRGDWALRMEHESSTRNHQTSFVTLTYDNAHLPDGFSLSKKDLQLFFKRLRRQIDYHYGKQYKFKYYACGEYGPTTQRPHYHIVFFGLGMQFKELIYKTWDKCQVQGYKFYMTSDPKTFKYVAGYASKKLGTHYNKKFKDANPKRIPEFQLQSIGIGKNYLMSISDYVKKKLTIRYNGKDRIPPRYYRKLLGLTHEHYKDIIKEYHEDIYKKVCEAYKNIRFEISSNAIGSRLTFAGRYVSQRFFRCLDAVRDEVDLRLLSREATWRQKIDKLIYV